jgi:hypothetical protein
MKINKIQSELGGFNYYDVSIAGQYNLPDKYVKTMKFLITKVTNFFI